jgi:hypothetical protein
VHLIINLITGHADFLFIWVRMVLHVKHPPRLSLTDSVDPVTNETGVTCHHKSKGSKDSGVRLNPAEAIAL